MSIAAQLNSLDEHGARIALTNCCAATRWVQLMLAGRPFASDEAVHKAAEQAFASSTEPDWLEAFAAHPLIGDIKTLRQKYATTRGLAAGEQSGVAGADDATLLELAALNRDYLSRFGFIFIVCATGKTAAEMLAILKSRINNLRDVEVQMAAAEQQKITHLRLGKLGATA